MRPESRCALRRALMRASIRGLRRARLSLLLSMVPVSMALLVGCGEAPQPAPFDRTASAADAPLPETLAELGALRREGAVLVPVDGVAYALGHPLFSDYADKYRTLHLPAGAAASRADSGADDGTTLQFPVGTLITKTFHYSQVPLAPQGASAAGTFSGADAALALTGQRLVETRVLLHRKTGWDAVSYLWNDAGTEARRVRAGALLALETPSARGGGGSFDYLVPDANQCAACHATDHGDGTLRPIGPKPANLAAVAVSAGDGQRSDQYALLRSRGLVRDAAPVTPWPHSGSAAARAYLDANCAHCHSDTGAADTAGLDLRYGAPLSAVGLCKSPVAAGRGSGGLARDIWPGRPDASILLYRMDHRDPGVMMPELGRSLIHAEGVALIRDWIAGIEGDCDEGSLL